LRHLSTSVVLAGALACTAPCLAGGATFTVLNTVNALDVTVDEFGRTLVMTTDGSFGGIYIYEADANAYNYIGDGFGKALSTNGTEAVGNISPGGVQEAAHWTDVGGWQGLGQLPNGLMCPSISSGYDISGDGSIAVGLGWDGCSGRAFKWTAETGMVEMEVLANGGNRASVISTDGTTAAGFAQGTFARTPAVWNVADGAGTLFDIDSQGEISAISADGNIVGGRYFDDTIEGFYLLPFYRVGQGPIQIIDSLPGYPGGHMFGVASRVGLGQPARQAGRARRAGVGRGLPGHRDGRLRRRHEGRRHGDPAAAGGRRAVADPRLPRDAAAADRPGVRRGPRR
jgi:hypothetical protein